MTQNVFTVSLTPSCYGVQHLVSFCNLDNFSSYSALQFALEGFHDVRPLSCFYSVVFCMFFSRDRVSPLEVSPRTLFRYRFSSRKIYFRTDSPRRLYSKTESPGQREYFFPRRNKLFPGVVFISMRVRL